MPFLNVFYGGVSTRVRTDDIEDISQLRKVIKEQFGDDIAAPPARILLCMPNSDEKISKMVDLLALSNEFFDENGPCIQIRIFQPLVSQSLVTNSTPFPPNSGAFLEGLPDARQKPVIYRSALVSKISDYMESNMSLLITSPSFTGKTSLANLMYNHWQTNGKNVHFISFSAFSPDQDLDEYFIAETGLTFRRIIKRDCYLIMDEAQNIYNHPTFWGNLKCGVQICKVLAFGVFGLSSAGNYRSPSQFQKKWYYDDIKFTDQECNELVVAFQKYSPFSQRILIPDVIGDLFQFLNNHPGLVYLALHTLCYEFNRPPFNAQDLNDTLTLIANGKFLNQLFKRARCFYIEFEKVTQILGAETDQVMRELIVNNETQLQGYSKADLHRSGICITDSSEETLRFSSEIMRVYYRNLYYQAIYGVSGCNVITNWTNETVYSLLKRILELFNPQVFLNTQTIGRDGRRYERLYQDEFYRCCYMLAPSRCHPDVGALYGSRGFLDFYINGEQKWGFELLRNGEKLQGHLQRFNLTSGMYKSIPLNDYAVVDFYEGSRRSRNFTLENYYEVVFSDDFSTALLSHNGLTERIVCCIPAEL